MKEIEKKASYVIMYTNEDKDEKARDNQIL